jgi:acetylornithine/N-succinyldiaminopimelate aminotransferase
VVLAPGFLDKVQHTALLLKQRLAEIKDRHAAVIAEVRGEGLLIGMRAVVPSAQLVEELRSEKLLAVGAGENVVRLLPPLVVSEEEIDLAVNMIDRACTRIEQSLAPPRKEGAVG